MSKRKLLACWKMINVKVRDMSLTLIAAGLFTTYFLYTIGSAFIWIASVPLAFGGINLIVHFILQYKKVKDSNP